MSKRKYTDNVFINCPFDSEYLELRNAMIFTIYDCGFRPRCTLEGGDSEVRINTILKIIEESKFGIHDISRTELDKKNKLPRFNMPLELGLFLGAKRYGIGKQRDKRFLILDYTPYRYQRFISDIAGYDIGSHNKNVIVIISLIRNWLIAVSRRESIPGGKDIFTRFRLFNKELPIMCKMIKITVSELTYIDYQNILTEWLKVNRNVIAD